MKERVGIFGGTFDPPHRAHLSVARAACDELALDRLLWIPAGQPPHKVGTTMSERHHREEMTRLMTDEDVRFREELGEIMSDAVSYTVDTLERIHRAHSDWTLFLIMGEDQWVTFDTWRKPDRIRELVEVVVYRRAGSTPLASNAPQPDQWLSGHYLVEASTDIRALIRSGQPVGEALIPSVAAYVEKHGLYR